FISKEDVRVYTAQKKGKGRKAVRREVEPDYEDDIIGAVDFKDGDSDAGSDSNTLADPDAEYVHIGIGSPVRSAGPPSTRASTRASGSTAFSAVTKSNASSKKLTDAEIENKWGVELTAPPQKTGEEADQADFDEDEDDADWVLQFDAQYRAKKKKLLTVGGQTFALVSNVVECEQSAPFFQQSDTYKKLERLYYACCTHARDLAYNEHRFGLLKAALEGFGRYSDAFPVKSDLPLPHTAEFLALMERVMYFGQFASPGLVQHVELMLKAIEVLGRDWQKGNVGLYERAIRLRDELGGQLIALRTVVTLFKSSSILSQDDHPARVYLDRRPFSTLRIYLLCSAVRLSPSNGIRYAVTLLHLPKDAEAEGSSVDEFDRAFEADFGEPDDDFTVPFARLRAGISVPGEYKSPGLWDIVRDVFDVFLDEVPLDHPLHDKYGAIFDMWADVFLKTIDKHRHMQGLRPVKELEDYVEPRPVRDDGEAELPSVDEPAVKAENDVGSLLVEGHGEAAQLGEVQGVVVEEGLGDGADGVGEMDQGTAVETVAWGLEIPLDLGDEDRRKLREAAVISDVTDMAKYVVENWTDQFGPFPRSSSTAKWGKHFKGCLDNYKPGSPAAVLARLIADGSTYVDGTGSTEDTGSCVGPDRDRSYAGYETDRTRLVYEGGRTVYRREGRGRSCWRSMKSHVTTAHSEETDNWYLGERTDQDNIMTRTVQLSVTCSATELSDGKRTDDVFPCRDPLRTETILSKKGNPELKAARSSNLSSALDRLIPPNRPAPSATQRRHLIYRPQLDRSFGSQGTRAQLRQFDKIHYNSEQQELRWTDRQVWAEGPDGAYIYALNTSFVPHPPSNRQVVQMRSDGRYGQADHGLTPQFFCAAFPHLSYLPKPSHPNYPPLLAVASPLAPENIETLTPFSSNPPLRRLSPSLQSEAAFAITQFTSRLEEILSTHRGLVPPTTLRHAFALLQAVGANRLHLDTPVSWQSLLRLWGTIQRNCQELAGLIEYLQHTVDLATVPLPAVDRRHHLVGTFTSDRLIAQQLQRHHVPVWYISPKLPPHPRPAQTVFGESPVLEPLLPLAFSDDTTASCPWPTLGTFARDDPKAVVARVEYDRLFSPNPESYDIQDLQTSSRDRIATEMPLQSSLPKTPKSKTRGHPYKSDGHKPAVSAPTLGIAFRKPDEVPDWSVALDRCRHLPVARITARHLYPPTHLFSQLNESTRLRFLVNWLTSPS
ncbi:hypothetical protein SISSUDRAFT_1038202, partial [Sistotremastrum suecicum HHB10207 ss-3]